MRTFPKNRCVTSVGVTTMTNDLTTLRPETNTQLAADVALADFYLDASLADETKRAYRSDWGRFDGWCRSRGLDPEANQPPAVAVYLATLADAGKKLSTVDRALSSIAFAYLTLGYDSPRLAPVVRKVMKGVRRTLGREHMRASPILPADLRQMVAAGCLIRNPQSEKWSERSKRAFEVWNTRAVRDRALLTIGFAGAFRRSELSDMRWDDIEEVAEGIKVTIRKSKTDQERVGQTIGIPYGGNLETCPVRSLVEWRAALGEGAEGPVFRAIPRNGKISTGSISPRAIAKIIQTSAKRAGIEGRISGHSLRAGLATAAAKAGKPAHSIMRQTRHKTVEMVMHYIREEGLWDDNAAAGIGL
jgi:integrase